MAYSATTVPYTEANCDSVKETRTCTNGVLSGSFGNTTCTPATPAACTFNGTTVAHGADVPAFSTASVAYGSTCSTEQRTCTDGTLSGTFGFATCTPLAACPTGGTQVYATVGTFTFTLPEGCSLATLTADVWGAGGGSMGGTAKGGGGGYASGTISVTSAGTVTVVVGGPGNYNSGGGATAVLLGATEVAVGGGGGGGGYVGGPAYGYPGGLAALNVAGHAGEGYTGLANGQPVPVWSVGGTSTYGAGGPGKFFTASGLGELYPAGGGGGYLGGMYVGGSGAGSGGSSYTLGGTMSNGTIGTPNPGNTTSPNYSSPAGYGGGGGGNSATGSPGRVVLTWQ